MDSTSSSATTSASASSATSASASAAAACAATAPTLGYKHGFQGAQRSGVGHEDGRPEERKRQHHVRRIEIGSARRRRGFESRVVSAQLA